MKGSGKNSPRYVTVALRKAIERDYDGIVKGQWRGHLDEKNRVDLRPDIVWWKDGPRLIYAAGNEEAIRHVVRGADVAIICHALDLSQSPGSLLAEIGDLAAKIAM